MVVHPLVYILILLIELLLFFFSSKLPAICVASVLYLGGTEQEGAFSRGELQGEKKRRLFSVDTWRDGCYERTPCSRAR